jgi:putative intracellular protease/amidase
VLTVIVLFDRFTALDAVGPYEVLSSLPGAEVVFASAEPGVVVNEKGTLRLTADADMALTLAGKLAGHAVAQSVQLALEYDPQPPFQAGSPRTAPPAITAALRARRDQILT